MRMMFCSCSTSPPPLPMRRATSIFPEGSYSENPMPPTTEQAVIMLASHFYESRDGSTGGFFADNTNAAQQVWNTVNLRLRLDRDWKV